MIIAPPKVKPAGVPVPRAVEENRATNIQEAIRIAVNSSPEKNVSDISIFIFLPFIWNKMWMSQ
jgi:hypothetical protein